MHPRQVIVNCGHIREIIVQGNESNVGVVVKEVLAYVGRLLTEEYYCRF